MSWINIVWPMIAGACLTLALIHLVIWFKQRSQYAWLAFAILAFTIATLAAFEWLLMRSQTVERYSSVLHWLHVPIFVGVVSIVAFVRLHFRAGRMWLAWAVVIGRLGVVILNFSAGTNLNYLSITALHPLPFLGDNVSVAEGVHTPWSLVDDLNNLLLMVFVADAWVEVWRRGDKDQRRSAALIFGSLVFLVAVAAGIASLVHAELLHIPYMISVPFLLVLASMGYELGSGVFRSAQLAGQLQVSVAAHRQADERFRAAVEAAPNVMLMVDRAGTIVLANAQAEKVFGYPASALQGERVEMLIPERLRPVHPGHRGEYLHAPEARAMGAGRELFAKRKDGTEVPVEIGLNPIETSEGLFVLASIIDISERKRLEAEAARQRDELTHLSRVAMLGELSGSLAHELNQPLAAILSNAQAMQRYLLHDPLPIDELKETLADIVDNDKRAGDVIRRLRLLLKKEEAQYHPVDLNDTIEDVIRLMRSDLLNRKVGVRVDLARGLPSVRGDRIQLQQVLLNLVINGCDAMDGAARRLLVLRTSHDDGAVEVAVSDQGMGIPAADLERIFEPFVTTKAHGMGLGLAICRTIVAGHGGRLWATNNADRGATVHFVVPASATA